MPNKKKQKRGVVEDKVFMTIWNGVVGISYGIVTIFVAINIAASQHMPRVFFDLADGKKDAIVEFLTRAQEVPQFENLFPEVQSVLLQNSEAVYKDANSRQNQIGSLLSLLESNPESPEVLYSLHLLYSAEKNTERANSYLQKALALDPLIDRSSQ